MFGLSIRTSMQNLDSVAQKMSELCSTVPPVTNLRIELRASRQLITRPFFEIQPPDFAWKFVWAVLTNYAK